MLEKALHLHFKTCNTYYMTAASLMAISMMSIIFSTTRVSTIGYIQLPCMLGLLIALVCWIKALHCLYSTSTSGENAALFTTLPISEKNMVLSKILAGTIWNCALYAEFVLLCGLFIYCQHTAEDSLIQLLIPFAKAGYSTEATALTAALLPLLLVIEQFFFSAILLTLELTLHAKSAGKFSGAALYACLLLVQIAGNAAIYTYYSSWLASGVNLLVPAAAAMAVMALLSAVMIVRNTAILRKGYNV